jgi:transcriptional regulator with XRE-family HTH domain
MASAKKDVRKRVGDRIRQLRLERGWSQTYLSVHTGMSKTYISNLECGQKEPCLFTLEMFAQSFEISLGEFFRNI